MIFTFIAVFFPVGSLLLVGALVPIQVNVHEYFILPLLGRRDPSVYKTKRICHSGYRQIFLSLDPFIPLNPTRPKYE